MAQPYKRILIKVSGESLKGDSSSHMDEKALALLVGHVKNARKQGAQVCLVVGGGNILRGKSTHIPGLDQANADYMGMLATVMNGIALRSILTHAGILCRVVSSLSMPTICDAYVRQECLNYSEAGEVLIFAGGVGSPFFTTDTAATLRALEMNCDALVKLTKVDGVYDKDPVHNKDAKRFERLSFQEVLVNQYAVMDATSIALAREGKLPVFIGSFENESMMLDVINGKGAFTIIEEVE